MLRTYVAVAFAMTACLGLGEVESDDEPSAGGTGGLADDGGWPDASQEAATDCDAGTKLCGSSCVPIDDPGFGCSATECTPCPLAGALMFCMNLSCKLDECLPGRENCDGDESNGCEVQLATDLQHCGACNNACSTVNGTSTCTAGACVLTCDADFANCDNNPDNGCESSLTTNLHCGTCAKKCGTGFACQNKDCHCTTSSACDGGSFGMCTNGTCYCSGLSPCTGGKKCTPNGCQ
jgi:hypothetical protein